MKTIFFFLLLIFHTNIFTTTNASSPLISDTPAPSAPPPNEEEAIKVCLFSYWSVFIYNGMKDPIRVHVQSDYDDLGIHVLQQKQNENWRFWEGARFRTLFYAHFYWNSKTAFFDVWDSDTAELHCTEWKFGKERRRFWLVKEDGFYLGKHLDDPFPQGWTKLHDW